MPRALYKSALLLWSFLLLLVIITLSDSRLPIFSIATPLKVGLIIWLYLANLKRYLDGDIEIALYKYFIPFFIVAGLNTIASGADYGNLFKTAIYLMNLAIIPFLVYNAYRYSPIEFLRNFLYLILGILLVGLILKFIGFSGVTLVRYRGLLGNPNGLGLFTFFSAIGLRIITHYKKDILKRKHLWLGWGVIIISLFLSNSRNSMISLGIFLIFSSKIFRFRRLLQLSIVTAVILLSSFISQQVYQFIASQGLQQELRVESLEDMQSGSGRKIAHDFALDYIDNHFWIGKGIGTTENIFAEASRNLSEEGHQGNAHNSFFTIWIDTGFVGLVLFLIAWLIVFYKVEVVSGFGFPIMIAVAFSAYFESYLAAMLNPFTALLLVVLTLLLIPEFRDQQDTLGEISSV